MINWREVAAWDINVRKETLQQRHWWFFGYLLHGKPFSLSSLFRLSCIVVSPLFLVIWHEWASTARAVPLAAVTQGQVVCRPEVAREGGHDVGYHRRLGSAGVGQWLRAVRCRWPLLKPLLNFSF